MYNKNNVDNCSPEINCEYKKSCLTKEKQLHIKEELRNEI